MSHIISGIGNFASNLIGGASNTLFGNPSGTMAPISNWRPPSFSTPSFSGGMNNGTYSFNTNPALTNSMSGLTNAYQNFSTSLNSLLPQVKAGFGQVSNAAKGAFDVAMQNLNAQRANAVSNLQQNLAQRGLSGSSFGNNAVNTTNATYDLTGNNLASQEAQTLAGTSLQELDATHQLMSEANQQNVNGAQALLGQLNLEGELGSQLASGLNNISANNAALQSQILSQYAGARGSLVGSVLGGSGGPLATVGGQLSKLV